MQLNADVPMKDLLRVAQKEKTGVTFHFKNGTTMRGRVGSVTELQVVVVRISGREKYDAVVKMDEIAAVEVRSRA